MQEPKTRRIVEVLIHIIGWGIVFAFPFLLMNRSGFTVSWIDYLRHGSTVPISFLIVFYINYCFFIPRFLFEGRIKQYIILNLLLILCTAIGVHFWQDFIFHTYVKSTPPKRPGPPSWIFILRDVFSMVLTVGLAAAIRMSGRWIKVEAARREAEKSRTEAAVQELSRLLRHVLYDNQQNFVALGKEMDFIRNYIELMRIRLASNVTVETQIDVRADSRTEIAPLIFISLIENAFKHGISPTEPSFIRIHFSESPGQVCCEITNSYHPKSQADKSGSGIGLEQVRKRLELTYPGRYEWKQGVSDDRKEYKSILVIRL